MFRDSSFLQVDTDVLKKLAVHHESLKTDQVTKRGELDFASTIENIKVILGEIRSIATQHGVPETLAMDDRWIFEELKGRDI